MAEERAAVEPGGVLGGRYRLRNLIGSGGMATVWRAEDTHGGPDVAVKVIADTLAHDPNYVRRFRQEAEIVESLDHPAIVRVVDHDADASRPYLVMELLDGGTLADALESGAPIDAVGLARRLLDGLDHIHSAGVVHRDLKPANVLIGPDGSIKLTDFGIARAGDGTRLTMTGNVIGTLRYMAPEVQAGQQGDARSDLYSAGTVIAEAAGDRPAAALGALIEALRAEDPARRPESARKALAMLAPREREPMAGVPMPPTVAADATDLGRTVHRELDLHLDGRRIAAVLAALGAVGIIIALALGGGGDSPTRSDRGSGGSSAGASNSSAATTTSTDSTTPPTTSTTAVPATTTSVPSVPLPPAKPDVPGNGKGHEKAPKGKAKGLEKAAKK